MAYNKTTWINQETLITAENMNNIENGIESVIIKANENADLLDNIKSNAPEELDTFKEVADALSALDKKIDVDNISFTVAEAIEKVNSKANFVKNTIVKDGLIGYYDPSSYEDGMMTNVIDGSKVQTVGEIEKKEDLICFLNGAKTKSIALPDVYTVSMRLSIDSGQSNSYCGFGNFGDITKYLSRHNTDKCFALINVSAAYQNVKNTFYSNDEFGSIVQFDITHNQADDYFVYYINGEFVGKWAKGSVPMNVLQFGGNSYGKCNTSFYNVLIYNRQLESKEILHNFSILNNSVSINEINNYAISTNTSYIKDKVGTDQDIINHMLYKYHKKDFYSDGKNIVVNNGLNGYLLNGKIEGRTIKNEILDYGRVDKSYWSNATTSNIFYSETYYSLINSGYLVLRGADYGVISSSIDLLKDYTFILEIKENPLEDFELSIHTGERVIIEKGFTGIKRFTGKIKSLSSTLINASNTITASKDPFVFRFMLVEGDGEDIDSFFINSFKTTNAVLTNNGEKYSFYANEKNKKQNKVIELNKVEDVSDTLEILEDGSGIYTQNTMKQTYDISNIEKMQWGGFATTNTALYSIDISIQGHMDNGDKVICICDKFASSKRLIASANEANYLNTIAILPNGSISFRISIDSQNEFLSKLKEVGSITLIYKLAAPMTTYISKEIMPKTILTYENNCFEFGEGIKPSKCSLSLPTKDDVKKEYDIVLLNNYAQVDSAPPSIVKLMKDNKTVKIQMDLLSPSANINTTLFTLPVELRPKTYTKIPVFVKGVGQLATINPFNGNVILSSAPPAKYGIYINTEYRRDM